MTNNINLKLIVSSFVLGATFLNPHLKASEPNDNIFDEPISKKRRQESESEARRPLNKKPRLETNRGKSLQEDNTSTQFSFFNDMLTEILWQITSLLPAQDRNNFALCNKKNHEVARDYLMSTDIRSLKDLVWVNGPKKNTFENYLFNNVIWTIGIDLLMNNTLDDEDSLDFTPMEDACAYLKDRFKYLKISKSILMGIQKPHKFLKPKHSKHMQERALNNPKGGEAGFIPLASYLAQNTYELPEQISTPMGFMERFKRVEMAHDALGGAHSSPDTVINQGEFLLKYDLYPTKIATVKLVGYAYSLKAQHTTDKQQILDYSMRAAELSDAAIAHIAPDTDFSLLQVSASSHIHIRELSGDPTQELKSLKRAATLTKTMIDFAQEDEKNSYLMIALISHVALFKNTNDPNERKIEVNNMLQSLSATPCLTNSQDVLLLKMAALFYQDAGEQDMAQRLKARLETLSAPK